MQLPEIATAPTLGQWALPRRGALAWRQLLVCGVISIVLVAAVAIAERLMAQSASPPIVRLRSGPRVGLSKLPPAAWGVVSATLGAHDPAYHVSVAGADAGVTATGWQAWNLAQGLRMRFDGRGVGIDAGKLHVHMRLRAFGYGGSLRPVGSARSSVRANGVTYARNGISEWYRNGPLGLEQGFTILRAPRLRGQATLTLSLALTDNAGTIPAAADGGFTLGRPGGPWLHYRDLQATDARGRALPCWLELQGDTVGVRVDARGARYPLRIDPLIQLGRKLGQSEEWFQGPFFGDAVALSADGTTALIGGDASVNGGAVWVFTRSAAGWTQQGLELTAYSAQALIDRFGASLALSADGNIALIGDPQAQGAHEGDGSAWIFTRVDDAWTRGPQLVDEEEVEKAHFGVSVALSADGNTALIGGFPATWVFTRAGASWVQQAKLLPEGSLAAGSSVALSTDGNMALIGSPELLTAWVFTRSGSAWTQSEILSGGQFHEGFFGSSVALSSDGNTALVGEPPLPETEGLVGCAWVFTRTGSTWTPGTKLSSAALGTTEFGSSVVLSGDGNMALIGSGGDDNGRGAAWAFRRVGSSWIEQTPQLTGGEEENGDAEFGTSVALSGDGNFALVGAPNDTPLIDGPGSEGGAWAFASAPPSATTSGASNVGNGTATLNAEVDPRGLTTTTYFQYGTTTTYGYSTTVLAVGSAETASPLTSDVTGLTPATTYHFRVVAESSAGTSYGADQAFTTAPVVPVAPAPVAPVNRVTPTISGTPIRGQALSVSQGTWANTPTSFSYEWQSCDTAGHGCTALPGATGPTHILGQGEVGRRLLAIVTAANAGGSNAATAAASPIIGSLVESTLTWTFGRSSHYTIVESMIVKGIPYEGTVEVTCHGQGCPFARSHAARAKSHPRCRGRRCKTTQPQASQAEVDLTRLFKGRHLHAGTRIAVDIEKTGWIGKSFDFTIRANRRPALRIECLAPGSTQPGQGC